MDSKKPTLKELIQQRAVEAAINAKLATGKFSDTGAKYTPERAMSDHNNATLRMTATLDSNNKLNWSN